MMARRLLCFGMASISLFMAMSRHVTSGLLMNKTSDFRCAPRSALQDCSLSLMYGFTLRFDCMAGSLSPLVFGYFTLFFGLGKLGVVAFFAGGG